MSELFSLVITVDRYGEKSKVLMKGPLHEIDKFTTTCESTGEVRENFSDEIEEFYNSYGEYMQQLTVKNNKKERGDITILNSKKEKRIRILYKKHLFVFKKVILDNDFIQFVITHHPELYKYIILIKMKIKHILSGVELNEESSIIIRNIYKIYKEEYAKQYGKPSPDMLYSRLDIPEPPDPSEEDPEYEKSEEQGPRLRLVI